MKNNLLNSRQIGFIIAVTFSVSKLYILPAVVSSISNESAWVSIFINFFIDFILLLACVYIIKNRSEKGLYKISENLLGTPVTKGIFIIYALYFMLKAFIPILEQKSSINLTFYESQPTLLTFIPFYIVAFYIAYKGANAFGRSVEICGFLWAIALLITLSLSFTAGKYSELLPLFKKPLSTVLNGSKSALLWFGDPIAILFLSEYLTDKNKLLKSSAISFLIASLATLIIVVVFYSIFGSIAERQYFAPLKMSKYSIALSNIGRFDYFGAMLLSLVSVFSLSLPLMLSTICINKVLNLKQNVIVPIVVCLTMAILTFIFQNELLSNVEFLQKYLTIPISIVAYGFTAFYALSVFISSKMAKPIKRRANV